MSQSVTTGTPAQSTHVTIVDGQPTTTTLDIAAAFGKRHDNVLSIVRSRMADAGEWGLLNFKDTPHTDPQNGQTYPVIRMTEKGFMFVVQKFTGKKAVAVQIQYVDEFERMRNFIKGQQVQPPVAATLMQDKTNAALEAANAVAAQVQAAVFKALMAGGKSWQHERWMLSFIVNGRDESVKPHAEQIESDAVVMPLPRLATSIRKEGDMLVSNAELANLASACSTRLAQRMQVKTA